MRINFSSYSACLLIVTAFLYVLMKTKTAKNSKMYVATAVILLSVIAYLFDPIKAWIENGNYTDLYRFFQDMEAFRVYGWNGDREYFSTTYNNLPLVKMFLYFISLLGNFRFLSLITCLIVYGFFGKLLCDIQCDEMRDARFASTGMFMFIAMENFKVAITNIRMPIGMTLFCLILYYDMVKKKSPLICFACYFALLTIHSVFALFILIRLLAYLTNKFSKVWIYILVLFSGVFVSAATEFLQKLGNGSYILSILYKIDFYTKGSKSEYYEIPIIVISLIKILTIVYLFSRPEVRQSNKDNEYSRIINFSKIYVVFCLGAVWNYYLFIRMTSFIPYLMIILFNKNSVFQLDNNYTTKTNDRADYQQYVLALVSLVHVGYYFLSYQYRIMCF
ncbi:hypothetical protein [Ruminococcus flavefaciens]|uniref:hypothetical protein n=1 Tax=Ruminococcus flavefaciens TaxID=1265 RepID=UPI000463D283|nr:hypothetical protein [Ruminococcus flavefaciens]